MKKRLSGKEREEVMADKGKGNNKVSAPPQATGAKGSAAPSGVETTETGATPNTTTTTTAGGSEATATTTTTTTTTTAAAATTVSAAETTTTTTTTNVNNATNATTATPTKTMTTTGTDAETTPTATVGTMTPPPTPAPAETLTAKETDEEAQDDAQPVPKTDSFLISLLGDRLVDKNNAIVKMNSLCTNGKYIGLYFSAHWCPPCRAFTPELVDFYKKFKSTDRGDQLEIIFVSFDRNEGNFKSYFAEMPWLAVPYDDQEIRESAGANFSVSGIPSLIFVKGSTGEVVQKEGRGKVSSDPTGKGFPWG